MKANKTTVTYLSIYGNLFLLLLGKGNQGNRTVTRVHKKKEEKHSPQHAIQPLQPSPQPTLSNECVYIIYRYKDGSLKKNITF
jgi:hypothetical protein